MAKQCEICKRRGRTGFKRSHSMRATKRKFEINLRNITYKGKKIAACAKCIKSLYKKKK